MIAPNLEVWAPALQPCGPGVAMTAGFQPEWFRCIGCQCVSEAGKWLKARTRGDKVFLGSKRDERLKMSIYCTLLTASA